MILAQYQRSEIRKEYLKRHCDTCEQRPTCKDPCPIVIGYVTQDNKNYQREKLSDKMTINDKNDYRKWEQNLREDEDVSIMPEDSDDDRS